MTPEPEPPGPHDPDGRVISHLVAACLSFGETWARHEAERSPAGDPTPYTDVGLFANHLVDLLESGSTTELPAVFAAVEELFQDGDEGIHYLLKVGLLEDLGNVASNRHGWPWAARFRRWFGPDAELAWEQLHREWGTSDAG